MKLSVAASLVLLRQVTGQSPCPSDLSQTAAISETETLYYDVVDGVLCARIESQSEGWLGFGISPDGSMVGAEAVIGLPDEGSVLKYDLTSKSDSGVVLMSDDKQTLMDTSIVQEGGTTTMTFAKIMDEDQYPLVIGANTCIFAQGSSNTLGYHKNRGSFVLELSESSSTATSSTVASSAETTPAPDVGASSETPESSAGNNVARTISSIFLGLGVVATWVGF